jgi:hypothetical protein
MVTGHTHSIEVIIFVHRFCTQGHGILDRAVNGLFTGKRIFLCKQKETNLEERDRDKQTGGHTQREREGAEQQMRTFVHVREKVIDSVRAVNMTK